MQLKCDFNINTPVSGKTQSILENTPKQSTIKTNKLSKSRDKVLEKYVSGFDSIKIKKIPNFGHPAEHN